MAQTIEGTPFKLATIQSRTSKQTIKSELESVLRSTDAIVVLDFDVVAVMAGSLGEVKAGAVRVQRALGEQHSDVEIHVEREPFKKRLQQTAQRVIRGEIPVHRRVRAAVQIADDELRRLYDEMKMQAWMAQHRVEALERDLRRLRLELEMQIMTNEQLKRDLLSHRKKKFGIL